MGTPRVDIAAQIRADWPDLDVYGHGHEPTELRKQTVSVFREQIAQTPTGGQLVHQITIRAYGLHAHATAQAETALDDLLDKVLVSLRRLDVLEFKTADRRVLADAFQGWEISCTWTSVDIYKQTVTNERQ